MKRDSKTRRFAKWAGLIITTLIGVVWFVNLRHPWCSGNWRGTQVFAIGGRVTVCHREQIGGEEDDRRLALRLIYWSQVQIHAMRAPMSAPPSLGWFDWRMQAPTWFLTVPWWALFLPLAAVTIAVWRVDDRVRRRVRAGCCVGCGYDRRGLAVASVCPECGVIPHRPGAARPRPRLRKAVKWGATLVAAALAIAWVGSVWTRASWGNAHKDRLVVQHGQCTLRGGKIAGVGEFIEMVTDGWSGDPADVERDPRFKAVLDQYRFRLNVQRTTPDFAVAFAWTRIPPPSPFLTHGGGFRSPWLLTIPLWVAVAPATVLAAFLWRFDRRATRRALGNVCFRCGYDRRGLAAAAVCPECGGTPSNDLTLTPALTPALSPDLPAPSHPHPPT